MRTIISALHFQWRTMADCIETATAGLGLDGVELSWHDSFRRPHCTREDIDALASPSVRGEDIRRRLRPRRADRPV